MSNRPNNKRKWGDLKKDLTDRRKGVKRVDASTTLTVQRLSENVEGKCQKYRRLGPLTMVKIDGEMTLTAIKEACIDAFDISPLNHGCDVMAGERGPSLTEIGQIKNLNKVVHVRFFLNESDSKSESINERLNQNPIPRIEETFNTSRPTGTNKSIISLPSNKSEIKYPVSISLSQMLKVGKLIKPEFAVREVIEIKMEEFGIEKMQWAPLKDVKLSVCKKSFAKGGFRAAYNASPLSGLCTSSKYVVKKYLPEQIPNILNMFDSLETHTRKCVQMNSLAANFAQSLKFDSPPDYGTCFSFNPVFFGKTADDECITLEKHIDGLYAKYINNTGHIVDGEEVDKEICSKASTFVHFTYEKSNKTLMVVDIQGSGYELYDPEVATANLSGSDGEILFCSGNLSSIAIENFVGHHVCNRYCEMLGLKKLD